MALVLTVVDGSMLKIGNDILIKFKRRKRQMRIVLELPQHIQVQRIINAEDGKKKNEKETTGKSP